MPLAIDDPQRQALQRRGSLSAPGARARQSRGRDRRARDEGAHRERPRGGYPQHTARPATSLTRKRAAHEVILSGGAINSPQLLMLSGIGDPEELRRHGRHRGGGAPRFPGVGRNLQDHITADVDYRRTEPGPLHRALRFDRVATALSRAHFLGKGLFASVPNTVMAYLKSAPEEPIPDIQMLFRLAPPTAGPYLTPFKQPYEEAGFGVRPVVLRPESRGRLGLASADPRAAAAHHAEFLRSRKGPPHLAVPASASRARSSTRRRCAASSPPRSRPAPASCPMKRSTRMCARRPPPCSTRSAPARWGPSATRIRWSTPSCGCAVSKACASVDASVHAGPRRPATPTPPSS